ncbi:uncharacterized protein LOC126979549 isoform X2 [Leptidea sinapis]|nr:uncharacterized protein LOC126979549 isoform X2 [Leptidea sinapis]
MVYLRPARTETSVDANWLCGGVIVDHQHILTSAACIEDVKHFYVVSGTHKWYEKNTDEECIRNGAKKAVWKCVSKDYVYDADQLDNIRWMINDIAVVRVEDSFNFEKRVRGCDFIPKQIAYNNQSEEAEKPGTVGSIAGWGSVESFGDLFGRKTVNSPELLETDVVLISKRRCKMRWPERYHNIIDGNVICARDSSGESINEQCNDQELYCKELSSEDGTLRRHYDVNATSLLVHSSRHLNNTRRSTVQSGGFCENDHGGPLIVGHGPRAILIGLILACQTANITQKCYGPYLYTSVYKNRFLISCAIEKDLGATCKQMLRSSKTRISEYNWANHPDGPAKSEDNSNYLRSHMNETIHKKFAKRSRHNRQQRQLSEN